MKLVSVVIPFYKGEIWLQEALDSVFNQSYKNLEVILVNDGSKENLNNLLDKFHNKISYFRIQNHGPGYARNVGMLNSKGDYIAFLDSDDVWLPNKLELQINFMESNFLMWSHTSYLRFWTTKNKVEQVNNDLHGNILPKCLIWNPIATPSVILNREILEKNSEFKFAVDKNIGEDSFFWQKIATKYPLGYLAFPLSKVRIHGNNAAFDPICQLQSRAESVKYWFEYKAYFKSKVVYNISNFLNYYCFFINNFLIYTKSKIKLHPRFLKLLYYIFYFFPFFGYRVLKIFV